MAITSKPESGAAVHLAADEHRVKDALRRSRRHVLWGRLGRAQRELGKRIQADKVACVRHLIAFLRGNYEAHSPESDLHEITAELDAMIRSWYAPATTLHRSEFNVLHLAEKQAQGRMKVAETRLAAERTEQRMQDWLDAARAYKTAQRAMREWVETYLAQHAAGRGDR